MSSSNVRAKPLCVKLPQLPAEAVSAEMTCTEEGTSSSSRPPESRKRKREELPSLRDLRLRLVPPEHRALQSEVHTLLDVEPSQAHARLHQAFLKWHLTIEELERLVLPDFWGLDKVFPSRRAFFHHIFPTKAAFEALKGRTGCTSSRTIFSSSSCVDLPQSSCGACAVYSKCVMGKINCINFKGPWLGSLGHSARWVESLNGLVYVRLMTDPMPTEKAGCGIAERVGSVVLSALRTLPLDSTIYWVYPQRVQDRMRFLSWVGNQLAMNPTWTSQVLSFLSVEDVPKEEATFEGPVELYPW